MISFTGFFFDLFAISSFKIRGVLYVIPFLVIDDLWKLINSKLLILFSDGMTHYIVATKYN